MYGDYIKEKLGDEIIENNFGFITYRYLNVEQCYIVDIYVKPQYREGRVATDLANLVLEEAKNFGCKELLGTVVPSSKDSTISLKVLLGYGMKLKQSLDNLIIFGKEI